MLHIQTVFFTSCYPKTAYYLRMSDWSSDVCSSDLVLMAAISIISLSQPQFDLELDRILSKCLTSPKMQEDQPCSTIPYCPRRSSEEIGRASCRERVCQYV